MHRNLSIHLLVGWLMFPLAGPAGAADYYFDANGSAEGSGVLTGSYAWSGSWWSGNSAGTSGTGSLPVRNKAVFSAGNDASGTGITLTGSSGEMAGIFVEEGNVTIQNLSRVYVNGSSLKTAGGTSLMIGNSPDFYNNTVYLDTAENSILTLGGAASGVRNAKLVKTGDGLAIFHGANTGSSGGTLTIHAGEFRIRHPSALPDGATTVNSGGTLGLSNNIAPARGFILAGGSLRNHDGANTCLGTVNLAAASTLVAASGFLSFSPLSGNAVSGAFPLTISGEAPVVIAKPLGAGTGLNVTGPGTVTLSAVSPSSGEVSITGGTLRLAESAGALGSPGGAIMLDASLEVINDATQTFANAVSGGVNGLLRKQGGGLLTLTAGHSFGGLLRVDAGTLRLGPLAMLAARRIEIAAGAFFDVSQVSGFTLAPGQTLAGSGAVAGTTVAAAGSLIDPGLSGAVGTLAFTQPLVWDGNVTAVFDLASTPAGQGDGLAVTGTLTLTGANKIRVRYSSLENGVYPLVRTTGGNVIGAVGSLQLEGFIPGSQTAVVQAAPGDSGIDLVVATNPYIARDLTWLGDGAANLWQNGGPDVWQAGATPVHFTATDRVTFDAAGANNPIVSLTGEITPGSLTVDAAIDYTFTGNGTLTGPMALVKSGNGRLIVDGTHAFSGGTTLSAGWLELRASSALGSGAVGNSGTLAFASASPLTFGNSIHGTGGIVQLSGLTILAGNNTFDGPVTITGGTLRLAHPGALGSVLGGTSVASEATLDLAGIAPGFESVSLAGGTLANSAGSAANLATPLAVSANSSLHPTGLITLAGGIHGAGGLTVSGPGTLILGGVSERSGALTVASGGALVIAGNSGPGPLTISAGANLSGSGTAGGPVTVAGSIETGATTQTLTFSNGLTLQAGSATRFKIQKDSFGLSSDRLVVAGTFASSGKLTVSLSGLALAAGDSVQLFSAATVTGSLDFSLPNLANGLIWDTADLATTGVLRVINLPAVSTIGQRRDWLLNKAFNNPGAYDQAVMAATWFTLGETALGRASALAASRAIVASHTDTPEQVDLFEIWPAVDLSIRYGNLLDAETLANIRQVVTTVTYYKDTNTSNLQTLAWVTRYLGGQLFGEEAFTSLGIANYWRTADPNAAAQLRGHITTCVTQGFREHASRPYYDKNLLPILSLGQLATDPDMRQRALLAYEAGLAQNAATWLRGHLGVATSRSYPDVLSQYPISSLCMLWFHFGGELPPGNSSTALLAAIMNQPVSPILETAASDRSKSFTARQFINDVHQTSFVDRDYVLFSDGPRMRGNFQVYPNGVVWAEPNSSRYSFLWVAKPFVDDSTIYVSHPHGRQTGYYKEAQTRDAVLYIYNIPAAGDPFPYALGYVPGGYRAMVNDSTASGHVFLHYGTVLIAIRSENPFTWNPQSGIAFPSSSPKSGDSEFRIYGTQFVVALETACTADFPGATPAEQLDAFRTSVLAQPAPGRSASAAPTASYSTRRGDVLTVALSADPATRPVTFNGAPVNYNTWPVLENPWMFQRGGDSLLALFTPTRREFLDFSNWTRRIQTAPTAAAPATAVPATIDTPVDIDLATLAAPPSESTLPLRFSVGPAAQGSVALQPDGRTARFTPAAGYRGPAAFDFTAHAADVDPSRLVFLYDYEDDFLADNWIADISGHRLTGIVSTTGNGTRSLSASVPSALTGASGLSLKLDESGTSAARFTHDLTVTEHDMGDADWTFSTWAWRNTTSNHDMVLYFGSGDGFGGSGDELYLFFPAGSNTVRLHHYNSANVLDLELTSPATATAAAWHHLAVSFTRSGLNTGILRLYLNGAPVATSGPITWSIKQSSPIVIGGNNSTTGSGPERWLNGCLDDTALFNRVLTPQEITALAGQSVRHFTGLSASATVLINMMNVQDQWRLENFGTTENTGAAADDADPDGDGSKNLIEYALGTLPTSSVMRATPLLAVAGDQLTLTFSRIADPSLTYRVEASADLKPDSWFSIWQSTGPQNTAGQVTVTDSAHASGNSTPPRRFLRLRVTGSP